MKNEELSCGAKVKKNIIDKENYWKSPLKLKKSKEK